ncbi:hypothetical protein [Streptomyces sp. 900105755]
MINLEQVDSLVTGGCIDARRAEETAAAVPAARQRGLDWRRFERPAGVNTEDLVDLLGELRAPEGVEPVAALVRERKSTDSARFGPMLRNLRGFLREGKPPVPNGHQIAIFGDSAAELFTGSIFRRVGPPTP